MDQKQFTILLDRIDKLSRVIVIQAVRDMSREQDKIELLDSVGFRPSEIGRLLGKSTANVSVVLGTLKRKREPAASSSEAKEGDEEHKPQTEKEDKGTAA